MKRGHAVLYGYGGLANRTALLRSCTCGGTGPWRNATHKLKLLVFDRDNLSGCVEVRGKRELWESEESRVINRQRRSRESRVVGETLCLSNILYIWKRGERCRTHSLLFRPQ